MTTAERVDLLDPDIYAQRMPVAEYAWLRKNAPVYWHEEPDGPGYWAITRYADVTTVSSDNNLFSSWAGGTNIPDMPEDALALIRTMMVNMDPPMHTKYRRLVSTGFTPKMIRAMEPHVREITREILDEAAGRDTCDFVTDVAAQLPLAVIAELMGVPTEDRHKVFDWSNRLIGFDDPEFNTSPEDGRIAATELFMYANNLAVERKARPQNDLVSVLMAADIDGDHLTEADFDGFFLLLSVAGNETTRNLISGGMLALIENPGQKQRLIDDPSLMPLAVEEFLRWVTPVMYFRRTATADTAISGQAIKSGDKVVMYYPSANRDEAIFTNGDSLDVGRDPNPHLAFGGGGPHFCLGASLARLEIRLLFEELLARYPNVTLAGPVARLRSNFINGIKHMPVRLSAQPSAVSR
jgi:cholest-4-en-3-one 26-monooxygenase